MQEQIENGQYPLGKHARIEQAAAPFRADAPRHVRGSGNARTDSQDLKSAPEGLLEPLSKDPSYNLAAAACKQAPVSRFEGRSKGHMKRRRGKAPFVVLGIILAIVIAAGAAFVRYASSLSSTLSY